MSSGSLSLFHAIGLIRETSQPTRSSSFIPNLSMSPRGRCELVKCLIVPSGHMRTGFQCTLEQATNGCRSSTASVSNGLKMRLETFRIASVRLFASDAGDPQGSNETARRTRITKAWRTRSLVMLLVWAPVANKMVPGGEFTVIRASALLTDAHSAQGHRR